MSELLSKVNDLESTLMLLGNDLESITRAVHDQERTIERLKAQLERLEQDGLDPLPRPEDDRPPHY